MVFSSCCGGQGDNALKDFYDHPMISSLYRENYEKSWQPIIPAFSKLLDFVFASPMLPKRSLLPAYIPRENFSLALLDLIAGASAAGQTLSIEGLRQALKQANPPNAVQRVVLMALATADDDLAAVQKYLENWYDATMQRVTGWYARRSATFLFLFGLGAAVVVNVDSITIAKSLVVDRPLRQAIVSQAEIYARSPPNQAHANAEKPAASAVLSTDGAKTGDSGKPPAAGDGANPKPISDTQKSFKDLRTEFDEVGYPIGWAVEKGWLYPAPQGCRRIPNDKDKNKCEAEDEPETKTACGQSGSYVGMWMLAIMGWLITAIAIMLGAPFWFDLLNKLISLRSAFKPPEDMPSPKK